MAPSSQRVVTDSWNRFWFEPVAANSLGLLRIFFGLTVFLRLTGATGLYRIDDLRMRFLDRGIFVVSEMLDSWHMPYRGLEWLPVPSEFWIGRIEDALLLGSILLTIGLFTRVAALGSAVLFTYMFLVSQLQFYHHLYVLGLVLWVLALSPSGRHYSIDALVADPARRGQPMSVLPLRVVQVTVCTIYFCTFLWKFNPGWLSGDIMQIFDELGSLRGPFAPWILAVFPYQFLSLGTLAIEGLFPFLVWHSSTRRVALVFGILFHLNIDLMMNVNTFSYGMMAAYIAFIRPEAGRTVVLYAPQCGLCSRSCRWVNVFDWFRRLSWLDISSPEARVIAPHLTDADLENEMVVITPDGERRAGFEAWRELLTRLPLAFVPSIILFLPGMRRVGDPVYRWIARHRSGVCQPDSSGGCPASK